MSRQFHRHYQYLKITFWSENNFFLLFLWKIYIYIFRVWHQKQLRHLDREVSRVLVASISPKYCREWLPSDLT